MMKQNGGNWGKPTFRDPSIKTKPSKKNGNMNGKGNGNGIKMVCGFKKMNVLRVCEDVEWHASTL